MDNAKYSTSDTPLAAYLISQGYQLTKIDYSHPRYEFIFDNGNLDIEQIKELAFSYLTGKARVDPTIYTRILRKLNRTVRDKGVWQQ